MRNIKTSTGFIPVPVDIFCYDANEHSNKIFLYRKSIIFIVYIICYSASRLMFVT